MHSLDKKIPAKPGSIARFLLAAATLSFMTVAAQAQSIKAADPNEQGDGTLSMAATRAVARGPLLMSAADAAAKAAANRASDRAASSGPAGAAAESQGPLIPVVQGGLSFAGQSGSVSSPPDTTGAIGTTRFVQLVNKSARIVNRATGATIGLGGTLNQLAGLASTVNSFDPQIIWDAQTNRFYYAMDSIFSNTDQRLSFGFSKTSSPLNVTTDWCHYTIARGSRFPDYPKLGDSFYFILIGVNSFQPGFVGSDLFGIGKPPAGTTCPLGSSFKFGVKTNLLAGAAQVFTPVPAQQVDNSVTGYVVARNAALPSNKLWFFSVTRNGVTGVPVFGAARGATVATYTFPADATQPDFPGPLLAPRLDTLDSRPTQAVQAINPDRGTFSFWTQHTIANGSLSAVRWYEINPVPLVPVVLRSDNIQSTTSFFFNAAISPDRRRFGASVQYGDSFVIEYNVSGKLSGISPRIVAGSSFSGGVLSFLNVRNGVGPYRDFTCPSSSSICRWGDYSAATPDPIPPSSRLRLDRGEVWGTSQYSGVVAPTAAGVNWRTWIFALQP